MHLIQHLANPPQGGSYRNLSGDLFPQIYPFDFNVLYDNKYFFIKYYMTQRTLFAIPKRAIYCNFEVLCNMFQAKIIDLSKAEIIKINTSEMSKKEMEELLYSENPYTLDKFQARYDYVENLDKIEQEIKDEKKSLKS